MVVVLRWAQTGRLSEVRCSKGRSLGLCSIDLGNEGQVSYLAITAFHRRRLSVVRTLVCLGALITIGSLALDFSFQQLVTYPPHPVDVKTAYMPASPTYSSFALTEDVSDGGMSSLISCRGLN